jgi:hypothetical protein
MLNTMNFYPWNDIFWIILMLILLGFVNSFLQFILEGHALGAVRRTKSMT